MTDAIHGISKFSRHGSPGPGWDAIAGGDDTQAVWLQAFPGSVELRIQPFPWTLRLQMVVFLGLLCGGAAAMATLAFWMDARPREAGLFGIAWSIGTAVGIFIAGPLAQKLRAKKSLGRVRLSDALVRIDLPTAPMWRNSFAAMPRDIRGVSVCRSPWYRSGQPFDTLVGISRHEVHIERTDGTRFVMSHLEPQAAEAIAVEIKAYAGRTVSKREA